ncbi:hypothetical protein FRC18_004007 [Serendipita sp. 400]|nr:hypothetical protein FRC18_004007 [Serendipita sp. 400]
MPPSPPTSPPSAASLKAWWKQFTLVQRFPKPSSSGGVFGVPLRDSLRYASVQISTANQNNELYVWGYIPVVVAKCGLFLKQKGTEVEGIFRINGSSRRMRELQTIFETPPRYGKNIQWEEHAFTPHDVASVFRRFLTSMPEPVIPNALYHDFRNAYSKKPFNQEEVVGAYKRLIARLPLANQYLLLYVLDLLTVFAKKSDINKMTSTNLAVIFRPAVLNHPAHEMSPEHHKLSQEVLEFMIEHQDWFMLDIPPPPRKDSIMATRKGRGAPTSVPTTTKSKTLFSSFMNQATAPNTNTNTVTATTMTAEPEDLGLYVGPVSDEEEGSGWRLAGTVNGTSTVGRRRTFSERGSPRPNITDESTRGGGGFDARRSAENVSSPPSSSSAPTSFGGPLKTVVTQLTPVHEGSGGDLENDQSRKESSSASPLVASSTGAPATGTATTTATGPVGTRSGGGVEGEDSSEGGTKEKEKRAKFDNEKLAKNEKDVDRERRGRSSKVGFFSGVRRSRTVEDKRREPVVGGGGMSDSEGKTGHPERHLLKKRNSKGEVEKTGR